MARFPALILVAASYLAACSPESGGESIGANLAGPSDHEERNFATASQDMPSFDIDEVDARDLVERLGGPWRSPLLGDAVEDGFSGGYARTNVAVGGSSRIMTLPNGKVWNLQLLAGLPSQCGAARAIVNAVPSVLARISPGQQLTGAQLAELKRGLNSDRPAKVLVGRASLTTLGGCVKRLDVRARAAT